MKLSVRAICLIGMFTALTSVLSILSIPTPWGVPFTLQTFAVALAGFVLAEYGAVSIFLYVLLGFCGVPVYHGMTSGPAVLFGPTGGFLWGFLIMAFLCGAGVSLTERRGQERTHAFRGVVHKKQQRILAPVLLGSIGLLVCHLLGTVQFYIVMNRLGGSYSLLGAAVMASVPYLLKDLLSVVGAYAVSLAMRRAFGSRLRFER